MIFQVLLSLSLAVVVLGDGCCTPKQWEGFEMAAGGYTAKSGRKGSIHNGFRVSYDAEGKRIAVSGRRHKREGEGEEEDNAAGARFKVIFNFQKKMGYFINQRARNQTCKSFQMKKKFREACIPNDAELLGSSFLGAGKNSLDVTAYKMAFNGRKAHVMGVATVTKEGCIPVSEDWWGEYRGAGFFENVNFAGITAGIKDPTVFDPPEFCQKVNVDVLEEEYEQFNALRVSFSSLVNQ